MANTALDMKDYMTDSQGRLVPANMVAEIDKTRDSLVRHIVEHAERLQADMIKFKEDMMANIQSFVDLSAMEYGVTVGGAKGNILLTSYDGKYKVQITVAENIEFDERLAVAKKMIDECIERWSEGSRAEIRAIINDAFLVNKQGRINTQRILTLRRLNIQDELWQKAMRAISDSVTVAGTSTYIRAYTRDDKGVWQAISLDMAKL